MPLDLWHLDDDAIMQLYHWLRTCYDWEGSLEKLSERDITPETLAYEIVDVWDFEGHPGLHGYTWAIEDADDVHNAIQEVDLGDGVWDDECDGPSRPVPEPSPISQQVIPTICVSPVVEDAPPSRLEGFKQHRRRLTHKDLPALNLSPKAAPKDFLDVPTSSAIFSPPPGSASKKTDDDLNIGMAPYEVWSGKKTGFVSF